MVHDQKALLEQTQASLGHTFLLPTLTDRKASHTEGESHTYAERLSAVPMEPVHSLFVIQIRTTEQVDEEAKGLKEHFTYCSSKHKWL